jgi:hypothetical protein
LTDRQVLRIHLPVVLGVGLVGFDVVLWHLESPLLDKRNRQPVAGCLQALALGIANERGNEVVGFLGHHSDVGVHPRGAGSVQGIGENASEVFELARELLSLFGDGIGVGAVSARRGVEVERWLPKVIQTGDFPARASESFPTPFAR